MKYRKKPVVIEAFQLNTAAPMPNWFVDALHAKTIEPLTPGAPLNRWAEEGVAIHTMEGMMAAKPGDWIIRGIAGELYPCDPEIFAATYDLAEPEPAQ